MLMRLLTSFAFLAHLIVGGGAAHAYGVDSSRASVESRVDGEQCDAEAIRQTTKAAQKAPKRKSLAKAEPAKAAIPVRVPSVIFGVDRAYE